MYKKIKCVCGVQIFTNAIQQQIPVISRDIVSVFNPLNIIKSSNYDYFYCEYEDGSKSEKYYNSNDCISAEKFINSTSDSFKLRTFIDEIQKSNADRICFIKGAPLILKEKDMLYSEVILLNEIKTKNKKL